MRQRCAGCGAALPFRRSDLSGRSRRRALSLAATLCGSAAASGVSRFARLAKRDARAMEARAHGHGRAADDARDLVGRAFLPVRTGARPRAGCREGAPPRRRRRCALPIRTPSSCTLGALASGRSANVSLSVRVARARRAPAREVAGNGFTVTRRSHALTWVGARERRLVF